MVVGICVGSEVGRPPVTMTMPICFTGAASAAASCLSCARAAVAKAAGMASAKSIVVCFMVIPVRWHEARRARRTRARRGAASRCRHGLRNGDAARSARRRQGESGNDGWPARTRGGPMKQRLGSLVEQGRKSDSANGDQHRRGLRQQAGSVMPVGAVRAMFEGRNSRAGVRRFRVASRVAGRPANREIDRLRRRAKGMRQRRRKRAEQDREAGDPAGERMSTKPVHVAIIEMT